MSLLGIAIETEWTTSDICRFWSKVDVRGPGDCWEWQAGLTQPRKGEYGKFSFAGHDMRAHRFAALITFGPSDLYVLHSCDNTRCVNPRHLRYGDAKANAVDAGKRGRNSRGDTHGRSRLSEKQVLEIRALYAAGTMTQREMTRRYGVSSNTIHRAIRGRSFRHVDMNGADVAARAASGENHPHAKLSDADVVAIRARRANGERVQALADEYGVNRSSVYQLLANRWRKAAA